MQKIATSFIASVWFINGFYCKILNQVPRHELIVGNILSFDNARIFTLIIGVSEIIMTVWILSNYKSKLNAKVQVTIIALMNIIEFIMVPELLLWGKFNIIFAFLLILIIFYNECYLKNTTND